MSKVVVTAKLTGGEPQSVEFDFGDSLAESVELYGEEVVYGKYKANAIIDLQSFMRTQMKKDDFDASELQGQVDEWKPGLKAKGKSTSERIAELFDKLSPEERAAFLEQLSA